MNRRLVESLRPAWPHLACLLAIACGGGDSSPTPADTTPPVVQASPPGGPFAVGPSVALLCNDAGGSGCAVVRYTTDGSTPTAGSPAYAAPIAVSTSTTIKFFGLDNAGNSSDVRTEAYVVDPDPPSVFASPPGGTYADAQSVTLSCDDGAGSGCASVRYTTDGSTPTAGSPAYAAPIAISASTTLNFFGVDALGNPSAVHTENYVIANGSEQIAAIRSAPDGVVSLPVTSALVTYVRPPLGSDPAGFFLQDDPAGPAVFVAVDPATLAPVPAVGDRVSLTATQKATVAGRVEVAALTDLAVLAAGEPVEPLRVDVSAVDLPPALADYESELVSISGTVSGAFTSAGSGFVAAQLSTVGTPASADLVVRVPTALQDSWDLASGCSTTVRAPLWRFNLRAQATAWVQDDLTVLSCPAPRVLSATATSSTGATVTFDRRIEPTSVAPDGSQFAFTGGLVATGATTSGREVQVTTSAQTGAQTYTVTVAAGVTDLMGVAVDAAANSASFTGYVVPAVLRITEVAPNLPSGRDLVELQVVQGGTTSGAKLFMDSTTVATLPYAVVATGDVIVVHLNPDVVGGSDAPGSETAAKDEHPAATYPSNHDGAWDFHGGANGIGFTNKVLRVKDSAGTTQDGAAFVLPTLLTPPAAFPASLQQLQADGHWLPADCGGALCTYASSPSAVEVSASWDGVSTDRTTTVRRVAPDDTNQASDWAVGASSLGAP